VPLTLEVLLRVIDVSNRTGIKYPRVTLGTCKININYMYITYTFVFHGNLASLLVLKVLGEVALPVTLLLVVEARDAGLRLGHLGRGGNTLATLLGLPFGPFFLLPDILKSVVLLTINTICSFLISISAVLSIANNSDKDLDIPCML
jgi:hypothetical protein